MEEYDPNKRYFGPQGSQLCKIIPPSPPGMDQLIPVYNKPAYNHDVGYTGKRRSGFFGKLKDAWERWGIDKDFLIEMVDGIQDAFHEGEITESEFKVAMAYARLAYKAVRAAGWTFFRTGDEHA